MVSLWNGVLFNQLCGWDWYKCDAKLSGAKHCMWPNHWESLKYEYGCRLLLGSCQQRWQVAQSPIDRPVREQENMCELFAGAWFFFVVHRDWDSGSSGVECCQSQIFQGAMSLLCQWRLEFSKVGLSYVIYFKTQSRMFLYTNSTPHPIVCLFRFLAIRI